MERTSERFSTASRNALLAVAGLLALAPSSRANVQTTASEMSVKLGQSLRLSFAPDAGYRLSDVFIDGRSVGPVPTYRIASVQRDVDVEAVFVHEVELLLPTPEEPVSGGTVTTTTPVLAVYNPLLEGVPTYEFQIATDIDFTRIIASQAGIVQEETATSWTVPIPLQDRARYYWRVRATEGSNVGNWMEPATFVVNLKGAATSVSVQVAGYLVGAGGNLFEAAAALPGAKGLSVQTDAGTLGYDTIFAAGYVENGPAATPGVTLVGTVYELAPHSVPFLKPVTLRIPYSDADLAAAGVTAPEKLQVLTYNTTTLKWESVAVASVDRVNRQVVCQVEHFSLYTLGTDSNKSEATTTTQAAAQSASASTGGSGGGGGGGCFIGAVAGAGETSYSSCALWVLLALAAAACLRPRKAVARKR